MIGYHALHATRTLHGSAMLGHTKQAQLISIYQSLRGPVAAAEVHRLLETRVDRGHLVVAVSSSEW